MKSLSILVVLVLELFSDTNTTIIITCDNYRGRKKVECKRNLLLSQIKKSSKKIDIGNGRAPASIIPLRIEEK